MIEDLAGLDEALMFGFYHVLACGEMLSKHLTVVLPFLTLLGQVWILYPDDLWLFSIIDTI